MGPCQVGWIAAMVATIPWHVPDLLRRLIFIQLAGFAAPHTRTPQLALLQYRNGARLVDTIMQQFMRSSRL